MQLRSIVESSYRKSFYMVCSTGWLVTEETCQPSQRETQGSSPPVEEASTPHQSIWTDAKQEKASDDEQARGSGEHTAQVTEEVTVAGWRAEDTEALAAGVCELRAKQ